MVLYEKLEHFHRIAPINIERPIQKLDRFCAIVDEIHNIGFDSFNVIIADANLDARQAELAVKGTATARLKINDPLAEIRQILWKTMR
ncbi:hypothetical protein D3C74_321710 [compost metagenome]